MTDNVQQDGSREIPVENDEVERLAHSHPHTPEFDPTGRLVRLFISPKDFLPAGVDPIQIIGSQPRGALATLGTLAGEVHGVELHENDWQGKKLQSYWLSGFFQAVVAATGEVFSAPCAILPKAYGLEMANAFRDPRTTMAVLGVTVGLKATGRAIPYEWFIRDHMTHLAAARVAKLSDQLAANLLNSPLKRLPDDGRLIANA